MNVRKIVGRTACLGFGFCSILLLTLTGCVADKGNRPAQGSIYEEPPPAHPMPAMVYAIPQAGYAAPSVVQDDYIYYPNYQVYYSSGRHQYAFRDGTAWVSRPTPPGVPPNVLRASPSVKMDFHDSPENHHAAVVKKYPTNWSSPGANPGRNGNPIDYPTRAGK